MKCERNDITKEEEQEIFDNNFILSDKKFEINEKKESVKDIVFHDDENNEIVLSEDDINLILEDYLFLIYKQDFIVLKYTISKNYKIIYKKALIEMVREENK